MACKQYGVEQLWLCRRLTRPGIVRPSSDCFILFTDDWLPITVKTDKRLYDLILLIYGGRV